MKKNICPECLQERPDDDRVKAGMKCYFCAGYGNQNDYPPSRHHLNNILGVKEGGLSDTRTENH